MQLSIWFISENHYFLESSSLWNPRKEPKIAVFWLKLIWCKTSSTLKLKNIVFQLSGQHFGHHHQQVGLEVLHLRTLMALFQNVDGPFNPKRCVLLSIFSEKIYVNQVWTWFQVLSQFCSHEIAKVTSFSWIEEIFCEIFEGTHCSAVCTVWEIQDFSVTQNLREINFGEC